MYGKVCFFFYHITLKLGNPLNSLGGRISALTVLLGVRGERIEEDSLLRSCFGPLGESFLEFLIQRGLREFVLLMLGARERVNPGKSA